MSESLIQSGHVQKKHQQPALLPYEDDVSAASELPEKQHKRLENLWAGISYTEFFSRIEEETFAVLYPEKASCSNVPVNELPKPGAWLTMNLTAVTKD